MNDKDMNTIMQEIKNISEDIDKKVEYIIEKLQEIFYRK